MVKKSAPLDLPSFLQPAPAAEAQGRSPQSVSYGVGKSASTEPAALPLLPRSKRPSFSSHRNDANAALALNLLTDVETAIVGWHQALRETLMTIQQLYMAGPIIDGWLEAVNGTTPASLDAQAGVLRHGDPAQVAAYIEQLTQQSAAALADQGTHYRLCRLDADGRLQCELCPPEQLGAVSQAIARNQQLRQLLSHKQYLEAKLKRAAEALDATRKALDIRGTDAAADL